MKTIRMLFIVFILCLGVIQISLGVAEADQCSADTSENVAIVAGFFQSFLDGTYEEYINTNFSPLVSYWVVQDDSKLFGAEREAALTHTGLYEGPDGANYFFDQTNTEREVVSFDIHEVFGCGNSVAAFGSFRYRAPLFRGGSGDLGETEWATRIRVLDGKFYRYTFMEDGYAVSAFYRRQEEGIKWRRTFNGEVRDIITGSNGSDIITPLNPELVTMIYGYGGDDTIIGGNQNDTLYGGIGHNVITGNDGSDLFAIGEGAQGTPLNRHDGSSDSTLDIITDFTQGKDRIGLTFGLTFAELAFTQNGEDLEISISQTNEVLAILKNRKSLILQKNDFESFPQATNITQVVPPGPGLPDGFFIRDDPFGERPQNSSLNESANVSAVKTFLNAFIDRTNRTSIIFETIHPEVEFTVGGTVTDLFGAERKAVLPYTGLFRGRDGVQSFFETLSADRKVVRFDVEEVYSSTSSVAAFGTYEYISPSDSGGTGDVLGSEWAVRIWMAEDEGKPFIYRYYYFEDTLSAANGYRHKFEDSPVVEWTREFGGRDQIFIGATNASELLIGKDVLSKVTPTGEPAYIRNRIFAYAGHDTLMGQSGDDFLYGGKDNDIINGKDGHDDLYGGEGDDILNGGPGDDNLYGNEGNDTLTGDNGKDIFVLAKCDGSDTITDYTDGEDKIGLLRRLSFDKLLFEQVNDDVTISLATTGELLATLKGVSVSDISEDDFTNRSDSGAVINPRRDLLGFPEFGFGPDYPITDHPLIDLPSESPCKQENITPQKARLTFFIDNTNKDRFSISGSLKEQFDEMPFNEDVTLFVEIPDPREPTENLILFRQIIPAFTVTGTKRYLFRSGEPGIQKLIFEPRSHNTTYFSLSADELNFLTEIKKDMSSEEYLEFIRDIGSFIVTIQTDSGIWTGQSQLRLSTTTIQKQELIF
jgi:Ca2+-binding RTX toxin-like protein